MEPKNKTILALQEKATDEEVLEQLKQANSHLMYLTKSVDFFIKREDQVEAVHKNIDTIKKHMDLIVALTLVNLTFFIAALIIWRFVFYAN